MKQTLRIQSRISAKQRMHLQLAFGIGTLAFLVAVILFSYQFINTTRELKAEKLREIQREGRNQLEGYTQRNKLSLNHFITGGLDPAAPLLIQLCNNDLRGIAYGGHVASLSGDDIVLTASDGSTPIAYSIERYDPTIGKLLAWVYPHDAIAADEPSLFLYCGNQIESMVSHKLGELPYYNSIWHFNGNFNNNGSTALAGEYRGIKDEEGRFGGAKEFLALEKGAAVFEPNESLNFGGDISISLWVKPHTLSGEHVLFSNQWFNGGCRLSLNENGTVAFEIIDNNGKVASTDKAKHTQKIEAGKWQQLVVSYSQTKREICTYINGKSDCKLKVKHDYAPGKWIVLGAEPNLKSGFYNGLMDELRICNAALTANQVSRCWAIENQAETLIKLDDQEVFSGSPGLWTLAQFEATPNGDHVTVHWTTDHESNLDYFSLERSTDGVTFSKVASCFAAGNSDQKKNYFLNDAAPLTGNAYYRLRAMNFRKESNVSNTVSVHFKSNDGALRISKLEPNPFNDEFDVVFGSKRSEPMEIRLTSISGHVIYTEKIDAEKNTEHRFKFRDQKNLKPGIYFFSVHQNTDQKTIKLVKRAKDA
jgi:hypothetical protein